MSRLGSNCRRPAALAAAALGAGVLLVGILPTRGQGQGSGPTLRLSAPAAAAAGATTDVALDFSLPPGTSFVGVPKVRVLNARGKVAELLPMLPSTRAATGRAARALHTGSYRPGDFQLRGEADLRAANGTTSTAVSPWVKLTVPRR